MASNRQVWLKSRPNGIPQAENFGIREGDIPAIAEDEFLVQTHYLSSDPAARGWIADASTYWPRIEIGDTMRAFAVGKVRSLFAFAAFWKCFKFYPTTPWSKEGSSLPCSGEARPAPGATPRTVA